MSVGRKEKIIYPRRGDSTAGNQMIYSVFN